MKKHFASYCTDEITPEVKYGKWRKDDKEGKAHILNIDEKGEDVKYLNLLPEFRDKIKLMMQKENIKPHMYFHHLNSSQAMCLNFFYPLCLDRLYFILSIIDGDADWGTIVEAKFEKKSDDEEKLRASDKTFGEPTNFDFYIKTSNGYEIAFEIKYTEQDFGKAEKDGKFCMKYDRKFEAYKNIMPDCIIVNRYKNDFLSNYQLMRNLLFLQNEKRYVVFVVPEYNETVYYNANQACSWVSDDMRRHVFIFSWEALIDLLWPAFVSDDDKLFGHYIDFKEKYIEID